MHESRIRVLFLCDATDTGIVHACCACLLPSFCWYCHGRHGGMTRLSWSGWLVTYTDMICPPGDGYPLKVSEDLPWKSPEIAVVDSPTIVSRPIPRNRCEYPHISYISGNQSLSYIFAVDCMGLSSFIFLWWALKEASLLQLIAYRPFKVIQVSKVDDFGTNRKRVSDFLLVCHCNYGPVLHRFWDTATYWLKIAYFSYPSLLRCPARYVPFEISQWS